MILICGLFEIFSMFYLLTYAAGRDLPGNDKTVDF